MAVQPVIVGTVFTVSSEVRKWVDRESGKATEYPSGVIELCVQEPVKGVCKVAVRWPRDTVAPGGAMPAMPCGEGDRVRIALRGYELDGGVERMHCQASDVVRTEKK